MQVLLAPPCAARQLAARGRGEGGGRGSGAILLNVLSISGLMTGEIVGVISELALPEELQFTNPLLRRWDPPVWG